ncbi:uncharacterized protein B0H18DRAFT_494013 [Fomitopsis serialis]|uniref:uncharacterized protein n=1 Tax=Fomitopsis serialis TaxID=139415 RepID=UPI0020084C3A|nr:uncharacterized protein B0H18DRAFT_494013 [Neoantrodia serialis]KAH9934958.1 hypothetical protein B0H18DRAFT_494013 [Neoantrodia serialis]
MILNIAAASFHASVGAISALRAYAINGRSARIPAGIITLSLVGTGIDIYKAFGIIRITVPSPVGCALLWANSSAVLQAFRTARRLNFKLPTTTLILRDGTIYFR